jgi:hypothetical protein
MPGAGAVHPIKKYARRAGEELAGKVLAVSRLLADHPGTFKKRWRSEASRGRR